ncbi:HAMP domain-containing histidine kinase [Candidatus Parcubacteria bacterium]|nr:HAMP domain-containing histidine kinase [Candidatus Parcubacteria bacterium]
MFYYHLLDKNNKLVLSNLPDKLIDNFKKCKKGNELSRLNGKKCRQGKITSNDKGVVYLLTTNIEEVNSSRIFKSKINLYLNFIEEVVKIKNDVVNKVLHDITKFNGYCIQELFELIPESVNKTKTYRKQISKLEKHLISNSRIMARGLFKLNRDILHIKTECSNLKYLFSKKINVDKKLHNIYDAIKPSLHVYIPHLQKKNVKVEINKKSTKDINLNFEYLEASMAPLLDNIVKYILHGTVLSVYFGNTIDGFAINFDMISMAIKKEGKEKIFEDGFSGINATKNKLNGNGIGMTRIMDSLLVNNAEIRATINVNRKREKRYKTTNYERNVFQVVFLNQ